MVEKETVDQYLSWAEGYAQDGPDEWPEDHLNRCLENAERIAKAQGADISKQVAAIRKMWNDHLNRKKEQKRK